jgi:murein DD-endopeptidase MepM/ murein hydrolase activator NlpD
MLVYVGERVRRGEVIGRVGTTGASTGNHLHFEVRLSGSPRNPLNYLPGCLC